MEQSQRTRKLNKLNLSLFNLFNKVVDATVSFNYGKNGEIAA